ncbi:MAG: DUF4157 domain-containing protein [Myxococcota bacterium]
MAAQRHAPKSATAPAHAPFGHRPDAAAPVAQRSPEWAARAQGRLGNAGVQDLIARNGGATRHGASKPAATRPGPRAAFGAAKAGGAAPLPFLDEMEEAFGEDFSDVKAHLGRGAALGGLGARAAAAGESVAFAGPAPTKEEVAHELAHVAQARRAGGGRTDGSASGRGASAETEAAEVARRVAAGQPAGAVGAAPAGEVHGWWWDEEEGAASNVASGSCAQAEDGGSGASGDGYATGGGGGGGSYAQAEAPTQAESQGAGGSDYAPAQTEEESSWWDELWAEEEAQAPAAESSWWDEVWGGGGAEGAGPTEEGHGGQGGGSSTGHGGGSGTAGAPEESLDPTLWTGSPMTFTLGGKPYTVGVSDTGAVVGGKQSVKAEWEAKKIDKSFQTQLAPGLVATAGVNVGTGMTASGNLSFSAATSTSDVPMGATDGSIRDTVTVSGNLSLDAFAKGAIKGGIGAGVANVATLTGNLNASLAATGSASIGVTGSATRVGNPRTNTWGDWQGAIDIPAKLTAEVAAAVSASLDYKVLFVDGTWAEVELAKWVLGSGDVLCNARIGVPSGETIDTTKSEFKFNELTGAPFLLAGESATAPPYRRDGGGGASGAGPEGEQDFGADGAGGAPPSRSSGHGGAGGA